MDLGRGLAKKLRVNFIPGEFWDETTAAIGPFVDPHMVHECLSIASWFYIFIILFLLKASQN